MMIKLCPWTGNLLIGAVIDKRTSTSSRGLIKICLAAVLKESVWSIIVNDISIACCRTILEDEPARINTARKVNKVLSYPRVVDYSLSLES